MLAKTHYFPAGPLRVTKPHDRHTLHNLQVQTAIIILLFKLVAKAAASSLLPPPLGDVTEVSF